MKSKNNPIARSTDVVVQELGEEVLIYNMQNNKAFCLNETSALVWRLCDGTNSISDINRELSRKFNSTVPEDLIWLAIDGLRKENLLENADDVPAKFNGTSRRDLIKKIGLGTVIALPVVSSLVAPTAAHGQSCIPPGQPCDPSMIRECCSGPVGFCEGGFPTC